MITQLQLLGTWAIESGCGLICLLSPQVCHGVQYCRSTYVPLVLIHYFLSLPFIINRILYIKKLFFLHRLVKFCRETFWVNLTCPKGCDLGLYRSAKPCLGSTNRADQDENPIHTIEVYIYK